MLSLLTTACLSPLTYRADAKRRVSWLPLCGVYWDDELPDLRAFQRLPEPVRLEIVRLFSLRYQLWKSEPLSPDDQQFWSDALSQLPRYALFQRVQVSSTELLLQEQIEQQYDAAFEELAEKASKVTVTEKSPGVESFSTFDVPTDQPAAPTPRSKAPWWKRLLP